MDSTHYLIIGGAIVVVLALVLLGDRIRKIVFGKNGVSIETHTPPNPGKIIAEGNTAKKGNIHFASRTGGDVTAKNNTAAGDVNITADGCGTAPAPGLKS